MGNVDGKGPSRIFCRPNGTEEKQALERRDLGWKRSDGGQFLSGLEPERGPGKGEVTTVSLCLRNGGKDKLQLRKQRKGILRKVVHLVVFVY